MSKEKYTYTRKEENPIQFYKDLIACELLDENESILARDEKGNLHGTFSIKNECKVNDVAFTKLEINGIELFHGVDYEATRSLIKPHEYTSIKVNTNKVGDVESVGMKVHCYQKLRRIAIDEVE